MFPKIKTTDEAQERYTPPSATRQIIPYIPKNAVVWEMCWGRGDMATELKNNDIKVVGGEDLDCFYSQDYFLEKCDCIITNPPYRNNNEFLKLAIDSKKPFALLMRLEHIGGVGAMTLLKDFYFKILIPRNRIDFIKVGNEKSSSPFHSVWITYKMVESEKQIIYI